MGGMFRTPRIPGPSPAQLEAQERQNRLAQEQEAQLARQEAERAASDRARRGRAAGRFSLLNDDVGITGDERAVKQTLGG